MKSLGIAVLGWITGLVCLVYSLRLGALPLSWMDMWQGLLFQGNSEQVIIIHELRLPRAIMAALSGGILAASGVMAQAILRNPIAAPSLIGISASAGFFAAIAIVFPLPFLAFLPKTFLLPLAAFFGAALSAVLVFRLANASGRTDSGLLLLAGVAINSLAGAGTGILTFVASDPELRDIAFWNLGSVAGASWGQIIVLTLFTLPLFFSLFLSGRTLNAWLLGEDEAQLLGVSVEFQKRLQLFIMALAVGAAVSFTGVIGFVGLVVPHVLRMVLGPDHRQLLPQSFLWGAVLLLASDLIARVVVVPLELPIGIVTAIIGSPYFIYLLRQQYQRGKTYDPA